MPVLYDDQLGFFFEASSDGKMKLCNVRPTASLHFRMWLCD
jgi:hypothetical protein